MSQYDFGKDVQKAYISYLADNDPGFLYKFPRPIEAKDACRLFEKMNRRFHEWTGMTLAEYLETHR